MEMLYLAHLFSLGRALVQSITLLRIGLLMHNPAHYNVRSLAHLVEKGRIRAPFQQSLDRLSVAALAG